MERKYIAFISYKHARLDAAIAKRIHTLIESYVIPKPLRKDSKKLGVVFRDEEELPISSDLTESICTALDASDYLIVICSPESKASPWVSREINYFLKHHDAGAAFVVLVRGEPQDVFPYELTHVIDGGTGEIREVEPLALDVRAPSVGASFRKMKTQIRKLYAGMLGCAYDSLVQREKMRKMKRFAALFALCAILAGSFVGMLFAKNRELGHKNSLLTEAISLALERESELLASEAEESLKSDDAAAAIRYAFDALNSENGQRPYCPRAERVLFSVMDVFASEPSQVLLSKTALAHRTPIEGMVCSDDGRIVYTIDAYGTVCGFDASSGSPVWSVKLNQSQAESGVSPQIWHDGKSGLIFCFYIDALTGLDALSGKTVWETRLKDIKAGCFFSQEGQTLAYLEDRYFFAQGDEKQLINEYNFVSVSTRDGSLINRIPIMKLSSNGVITSVIEFPKRIQGVFVGSDCFTGTLFTKENGANKTLHYTVDLSQSAAAFMENETLASRINYVGAGDLGDDRAIILSKRDGTGLNLQCFDVKAGVLLWQSVAAADEYILNTSNVRIVKTQKEALIAVGDLLIAVDKGSGDVIAYKRFADEIVDLFLLAEDLFGFTLSNGYCAAGWWNEYGISDSKLMNNLSFHIPETPMAIHHAQGIIRAHYVRDMLDSFIMASVEEGCGSIVSLSEDRCTLYITTALSNPKRPPKTALTSLQPYSGDIGDYADMNCHGAVLMGPVDADEGYCLNVIDAQKHVFTTISVKNAPESRYMDRFYLTEDNLNVIACAKDGSVERIGMDGQVETLAVGELETMLVLDNGSKLTSDQSSADAARLTADGRVIAAFCDGEKIRFWTDGTNEQTLFLPDDVQWSAVSGSESFHLLSVGENGLVVLSDYASGEADGMDHFVVFDLSKQEWKQMEDAAHGKDSRLIAFGQDTPVFAVCDDDMKIRIYDFDREEMIHLVNTGLPCESVVKMGMLLSDQYLYVLTRDGRFMIYDIDTNRTVFWMASRNMEIRNADQFRIWTDLTNHRMHLCAYREALCVDVRTWEPIFEESGVGFYSAFNNEIFVFCDDPMTSKETLNAIPVPTTGEMLEIAKGVLN